MSIQEEVIIKNTFKRRKMRWKNRSKFTKDEDEMLRNVIDRFGEEDWNIIAKNMPGRNVRQCRERWCNYLSPSLNKTKWKVSEDNLLMKKVSEIGKKWVQISKFFHNRTDQMLKNRYNVLIRTYKKSINSFSDDEYDDIHDAITERHGENKRKAKTMQIRSDFTTNEEQIQSETSDSSSSSESNQQSSEDDGYHLDIEEIFDQTTLISLFVGENYEFF